MAMGEDSSRQREWAEVLLVLPGGAKESRVIEEEQLREIS